MAIPINETAKIYTNNDLYLMSGRFISKDDDIIHLAIRHTVVLKEGMTVKVLLSSESLGLMPFRCRIIKMPQRFAIQQYIGIELKIEEALPSIQRRRDIKVNLDNMKAEAVLIDNISGLPIGDTCEGVVENISASGLLFVTPHKIELNQQFSIALPAVAPQMLLRAKVIRAQEAEDGCTGYGCCFMRLQTKQEEALRQYVFKVQVMQRRNRND